MRKGLFYKLPATCKNFSSDYLECKSALDSISMDVA